MVRKVLPVLCLCVFPAVLSAGSPGIVRSKGQFEISRLASQPIVRTDNTSVVMPGDVVSARKGTVTIEHSGQASFALQEGSTGCLLTPGVLRLDEGAVAASFPASGAGHLEAEGLWLQPMKAEDPSSNPLAVVETEDGKSVHLTGLNETFRVTEGEAGKQLAILTTGDALIFQKNGKEWLIYSKREGTYESFMLQPDGGGSGGLEDAGQSQVADDEVDKKKGFWLPVAVVAGSVAVVGGGVVVIDEVTEDDDDDDNRNDGEGFVSPDGPPAS